MDETTLLLGIETLRSDPGYHAAEVLRRSIEGGAATMAAAPQDFAERVALMRLISTWEVIAVLVSGIKGRDKIFEVTPVCYMYRMLEPGIMALRKSIPGVGANFEEMHTEYQTWLKRQKKDAKYVSADCDGLLHARFG